MDSQDLFLKESFFKDNFNVDNCLSKYTQKSDLETLRKELKNYGSELQQQMSEILKTETEAIVNLAEYLTNLNVKIENLCVPVCQLREEIMTLQQLTQTAEGGYKIMLTEIKNNNSKRNNIHLKQGIVSSSLYIDHMMKSSGDSFEDIITLERIVNKYSFQRNYMYELGIISPDIEDIVQTIEKKLTSMISNKFLDSFYNNDAEVLTTCLRMYDNLRKHSEAQDIFRVKVVRPALEHLFTESYLEKLNQDLDKLYEDVLFFLDVKMNILFDILLKNPELKSYNFAMNSFWKEFDKQSRDGLPHITAPGNPELFQKRFSSTWQTLQKISRKCGDDNLIREDDTFQEHLKRFNLPVYFEIRYQKIAGIFENEILVDNSEIYASKNELSCRLKPTLALWCAVNQCFQRNVYIDQLCDQFLKLSMLLLSRYLAWFPTKLQDTSMFPDILVRENFVMHSLIDLSIVSNFMALKTDKLSDIENTIFEIMNNKVKFVILKVFDTNRNCIESVQRNLKDNLVKLKYEESSVHLQNVAAIPRLYRRTNRNAPKSASPYILEALKPVLDFNANFSGQEKDHTKAIIENLITRITEQYLTLVQEVLRSVCKTEESLRRLKSRNINPNEESSTQSDTVSDEMKIREQIKYDVSYFLDKLYPLGSASSREKMDLLRGETR